MTQTFTAVHMRNLMESINPLPKSTELSYLLEGVSNLAMRDYLTEIHHHTQSTLIPAFAKVFEALDRTSLREQVAGYTDQELEALLKKYNNNVQAIVDAHISHKERVPELAQQDKDQKEKALTTLKKAVKVMAAKSEQSLPNAEDFVAAKLTPILSSIEKKDPKGRFKGLSNIFKKVADWTKTHPKWTNAIVGLFGTSLTLLNLSWSWAIPSVVLLVRIFLDRLNGESWGKSITKNITWTAIGALVGLGANWAIGRAIESLWGVTQVLDTAVQTPPLAGDDVRPMTGISNIPVEMSTSNNELYKIQRGDTLSQIASRFQVSVGDLMAANPQLKNANVMIAGADLIIPPETGKDVFAGGIGLPGRPR